MRQKRLLQASLFDGFANHETGRELKAMSEWLDGHRELLDLMAGDLCRRRVKAVGQRGLPAEIDAALRASQAASPVELRGTGVPSGGFGVVSDLCAPGHEFVDFAHRPAIDEA